MVEVREDLSGKTFGRLKVICQAEDIIGGDGCKIAAWKCECSCGNIVIVRGICLKRGTTRSCGCYKIDQTKIKNRRYNKYEFHNDTVDVYISDDVFFTVSLSDFDIVKNYKWYAKDRGYIETKINRKNVYLHRLITKCPADMVIDHIDGNPMNNTRSNLRICSGEQNSLNKKVQKNNTSGIPGVSYSKSNNKWVSYIQMNNKRIHLGDYSDINDAIEARKKAEAKYYGEFARNNNDI